MTIPVKQMLVSKDKYDIKCPYPMEPEYITFHNTANDASAESEVRYMINNNEEVSFHFAVDDKEVIQGLPLNRNAWHCGDSSHGNGNRKSIGVEVCYSKSGGERYKKAEELAIKFIAQLLHERGWGVDRVRTHKSWTVIGVERGWSSYVKNCPHRVLDEGRWDSVVARIQAELDKLNGKKATSSKPKQASTSSKTSSKSKGYLGKGDRGSDVKDLQTKLEKLGYELGAIDGIFGEKTESAVRKFQKDHKLVVDGLAGEKTMGALNDAIAKLSASKKKASKTKAKGDMKTNSIVEYLQSIGEPSSFDYREKLAHKYGISNYQGTAQQNLELLEKLRGNSSENTSKKSKPVIESGIKAIGKIKIVGVNNAAIIMDVPNRNTAKSIGTIAKGDTISISGSVRGKNNPDGYWEVIYKGKRAYISGQFGKLL